jgi:hypothetical protein
MPRARRAFRRSGRKGHTGHTGYFWPVAASQIGDGQKRFPDIGIPVFHARRHLRSCSRGRIQDSRSPGGQLVAQGVADVGMDATAVGFHRRDGARH